MSDMTFRIKIPAEVSNMCLVEQSMTDWFMSSSHESISKDMFCLSDDVHVVTGNQFWDNEDYRWFRPYNVIRDGDKGDGVLVIPVKGALLPDLSGQFGNYATGYEYIKEAVKRGVSDPYVKSIILDINSPGGVVRGCSECGDYIKKASEHKKVIAFAMDTAASAAYWLASQANEIHVSNTGSVGSIGVITAHIDYSEMLKQNGIKYTPIFSGERKADMNPNMPLTDEAKAATQKNLNAIYAEFISAVASGRGMNGNDIRNTQAAMFASRESVREGLADKISTRDEVISYALGLTEKKEQFINVKNDERKDMTDQNEEKVSASSELVANAVSEAMDRVKEILGCDEAHGREEQARVFAFNTDLSVEKVKELLSAGNKSSDDKTSSVNAFNEAMSNVENPGVGAGLEKSEDDDGVMSAMLKNFK